MGDRSACRWFVWVTLATTGCFADRVGFEDEESGGQPEDPTTDSGATASGPVAGSTDSDAAGEVGETTTSETTTSDTTASATEADTTASEGDATSMDAESGSSSDGCVVGSPGCACGDGCDSGLVCADEVCVEPVCGNGVVELDEECDDGNAATQDGCESDCTPSTGVARVVAGAQHSCALFHDGRLRCWGSGANAKLGYGDLQAIGDDETPASAGDVPIGETVVDLALGREHTCVLLEGGALRCWGLNNRWQLGVPAYELNEVIGDAPDELPSALPDVLLGAAPVAIAATTWSTLVLFDTGEVICFGQNAGFGTCGYGNNDFAIGSDQQPSTLEPIELGGTAWAIRGGGDHACALLDDGNARCWGFNEVGALGTGDLETIGNDELPTAVPAIDYPQDIVDIQPSLRHTCVLLDDGAVRCWGKNDQGELGYGNTDATLIDWTTAADVSLGGPAIALASHEAGHQCALLENGDVRCWGDANFGRLGYGDAGNDVGDDEVPSSLEPVLLAAGEVHDLAVGNSYSCARIDEGQVLCWGANSSGQIGQPGFDYVGDNESPAILAPIILQ